jgi:tetratricopeptide (TPR) repeat protein
MLRRGLDTLPAPRRKGEPDEIQRIERVSFVRGLLNALVYQGRMREARRFVTGSEMAGVSARNVGNLRLWLSLATRSVEDARAAVLALEVIGALKAPEAQLEAARALAFAGDIDAARSLAEAALAGSVAAEHAVPGRALWEVLAAWRTGHLDAAEAGLRAIAAGPLVEDRYEALATLGEVEISRGKYERAVEALEKARATRFNPAIGNFSFLQPAVLYRLAVAYDRLGDEVRARERIDEFLRFWGRGDPDLPMLVEARAMQARLAVGATVR